MSTCSKARWEKLPIQLYFCLGIWRFIRFQGTKTLLSSSFGTASILVWLIGNTETPKRNLWPKEKILADFNPQTGWTTNTCEGWGPLHRLLQKSQSYRFCAFSFELDPHEKWIQVSNGKKPGCLGYIGGIYYPVRDLYRDYQKKNQPM